MKSGKQYKGNTRRETSQQKIGKLKEMQKREKNKIKSPEKEKSKMPTNRYIDR